MPRRTATSYRLLDRFDACQHWFKARSPRRALTSVNQIRRSDLLVLSGGILRSVQIDSLPPSGRSTSSRSRRSEALDELYRRDDLLATSSARPPPGKRRRRPAALRLARPDGTLLVERPEGRGGQATSRPPSRRRTTRDPPPAGRAARARERARGSPGDPRFGRAARQRDEGAREQHLRWAAGKCSRGTSNAPGRGRAALGSGSTPRPRSSLPRRLHQLGQHELAEAVLARRSAGGQSGRGLRRA